MKLKMLIQCPYCSMQSETTVKGFTFDGLKLKAPPVLAHCLASDFGCGGVYVVQPAFLAEDMTVELAVDGQLELARAREAEALAKDEDRRAHCLAVLEARRVRGGKRLTDAD